MRSTLVAALVQCAEGSSKPKAYRFLRGLSSDELQFIASFLGACILETSGDIATPDAADGGPYSEDRELKMILLWEYLCRAGMARKPIAI